MIKTNATGDKNSRCKSLRIWIFILYLILQDIKSLLQPILDVINIIVDTISHPVVEKWIV